GRTAGRACERLERVVDPIENEIFRSVNDAFGSASIDRVLQDVLDRAPRVAVPDERQRIDLGVEHRLAVVGDAMQRAILGDKPAVRVEKNPLLLPSGGDARNVALYDLADQLRRRPDVALRLQRAIVAEAYHVRPDLVVGPF